MIFSTNILGIIKNHLTNTIETDNATTIQNPPIKAILALSINYRNQNKIKIIGPILKTQNYMLNKRDHME